MVKSLERKHQPLSVRLGILRLQSNTQVPTIDGVELYLKILEAEAIKLQADDVSKPKNAKADSEEYHIPNANQAAAGGKGGSRLCAYFNTARGCLKGAECEFRHETAGTGQGAKGSEKGGGKAGEPKGKPKAAAKAEAKAEAKAAAKAQAKAATEAAIAAEAKAEAKRKAKADKKAAKAAAKAAAAVTSSTMATAATIVEDAIPFLAGASPNASSSDQVPRASMAHQDAESEIDFEEETEVVSLVGAESFVIFIWIHFRARLYFGAGADGCIRGTFQSIRSSVQSIRSSPKASTAVPKASAVASRENPDPDESGSEVSRGSPSIAMRRMYLEEENIKEIPALVGMEQILSKAHRLECTDQPTVNIVASQQQPAVLVDSGANETIRPWDETINEAGCKRTSVVTASGDRVSALRTKDGELCVKSNGGSSDWLLSVRRLVEAGGTFGWTQNGAEVTFRDHEGREQHIKCHLVNGLPFLDWTEVKIRILLSKFHKTEGGTVHKAAANDPQWRSCETCTVEELYQTMWREETYQATAVESQTLLSSETEAKEMLNKDSIGFPEVWDLIQRAGLKGQRTRRDRLLENQEQGGRVQMWVFGMYCHGGITGLTSLTRERPFVTRLLVRLMRQELPDLSFTTVTLAIDSTLKPHRDLANAVNSRAGIVGISEFHGGRLWVEHPDGSIKRRISADKVKVGKLLDVCQQAQIFDPRQWHGADKHQGTRATIHRIYRKAAVQLGS